MTQPPSFPPPLPASSPTPTPASDAAPSSFGYAAYPGMPQDTEVGPAPVAPRAVTVAFTLMLIRSALSLVGLIVTLATRNQLLARVEQQQRLQAQRTGVANPIDPTSIVDIGIVVGVVVGAAFLVFYVFLAFKVRRGRQWARVVTWVFAGLGVLGLLAQFVVSATGITRALGVTTGVLDIVIIVALALKPTSRFVAEVSARRRS